MTGVRQDAARDAREQAKACVEVAQGSAALLITVQVCGVVVPTPALLATVTDLVADEAGPLAHADYRHADSQTAMGR